MHELGNDLGYSMSLFLIFSEYLMVECPYISPNLTTAIKTEKRFTIPHIGFLKNIDVGSSCISQTHYNDGKNIRRIYTTPCPQSWVSKSNGCHAVAPLN